MLPLAHSRGTLVARSLSRKVGIYQAIGGTTCDRPSVLAAKALVLKLQSPTHCWHTVRSSGGWLNVLERVENPDIEPFEVGFIPCRNNQMMYARGGGDHGIFQQFVRFSIDDAAPFSKTHCVHR